MQFAFSQDQIQMAASLRDVLKRECPATLVRSTWTSETGHVAALWRTLAELGVVGVTVPEENGGLGLDELDLVLLLEECGRAALPMPIVETTAVGVPLLRDAAKAEGAARAAIDAWLAKIASGDAIVTVGIASTLVKDAHVADLVILPRDGELHAVSRDTLRMQPHASVDGSRRLFTVAWEATPTTRIAKGDAARALTAAAFDRGALAASAELVGLARNMIDLTVDYVKVRKQFGSAIGSFQAVKHHLANALVKLEFARPVVHRAAYSIANQDREASVHVSMAKACASDAAALAARAALQCHGAIGYTFEHDLQLWMKRAWALGASWGDAAWHRARVGTALFGTAQNSVGGLT